jgi:Xaa-Pro aminopeptidase
MVITIEPGIYLPGFMARAEDTILVTDDGYEILTECPTGIRVLADR